MATTSLFDTPAYVKKLQEAGFTAQQAEAQVEALSAAVQENLATKQDIEMLRHDIELARRDIIIWLGGMIVVATTALGLLMKLL